MTGTRHRPVWRGPRACALVAASWLGAACGSGPAGRVDAAAGRDAAAPPDASASACPPGSLEVSTQGWDADGLYTDSLPAHGGNDSYALGTVQGDGPRGQADSLAVLVLQTSTGPVDGKWIVKRVRRGEAYPSGPLDRDETLCLASLAGGVRWFDLGRTAELAVGPLPLRPLEFAGHVVEVLGSPGDDHILLLGGAGGSTVHGGAGRDILVDATDEGAELFGDDGRDVLVGIAGSGASVLHGGPGDDRLSGRGSGNRYVGDDGDDCLVPARPSADAVVAALVDGGPGDDHGNVDLEGAGVLSVEHDVRNTLAGYVRCGHGAIDDEAAEVWPHADREAELMDLVSRARRGQLTVDVGVDAYVHASPDGVAPGEAACPATETEPACVFPIGCDDKAGCSALVLTRPLAEAARLRMLDKAGFAPWSSPRFGGFADEGMPVWTGTEWPGLLACPDVGDEDTDGDGSVDLHDNPDDESWDVAALRVGEGTEGFVGELTTCGAGPDAMSAFSVFLHSRPHCLQMLGRLDDCSADPVTDQHIGVGYAEQTMEGPALAPVPRTEPRHYWTILLANQNEWVR